MSCNLGHLSDIAKMPLSWKNENHLEYSEFWNNVLRDSPGLKPAYWTLSDPEQTMNHLFPFKMKKILHKRSSENSNSIDMPVVFMPEKSQAQCITKPKVNLLTILRSKLYR